MSSGFPRPEDFSEPVVVYSTPICPYCRRAYDLLRRKGIAFAVVDVADLDDARDWLVATSQQRTVPQIFIHGESIGGYTELAALDRSGMLQTKLAAKEHS